MFICIILHLCWTCVQKKLFEIIYILYTSVFTCIYSMMLHDWKQHTTICSPCHPTMLGFEVDDGAQEMVGFVPTLKFLGRLGVVNLPQENLHAFQTSFMGTFQGASATSAKRRTAPAVLIINSRLANFDPIFDDNLNNFWWFDAYEFYASTDGCFAHAAPVVQSGIPLASRLHSGKAFQLFLAAMCLATAGDVLPMQLNWVLQHT